MRVLPLNEGKIGSLPKRGQSYSQPDAAGYKQQVKNDEYGRYSDASISPFASLLGGSVRFVVGSLAPLGIHLARSDDGDDAQGQTAKAGAENRPYQEILGLLRRLGSIVFHRVRGLVVSFFASGRCNGPDRVQYYKKNHGRPNYSPQIGSRRRMPAGGSIP